MSESALPSDFEEVLPPAQRTETRSLSEEACLRIKRLILSGVFKDGEKIPEERVAQILQVSRTPIREALRRLGQYGLVEIKPRSYARVTSITLQEAEHLARVRLELEKLAARTLVCIVTRTDIEALDEIAHRAMACYREGSAAEALEHDSEFHLELAKRSGNPVLYDILERLDAKNQLIRMRMFTGHSSERVESFFRDHRQWVRLLEQRDETGLVRAIETHIIPGN